MVIQKNKKQKKTKGKQGNLERKMKVTLLTFIEWFGRRIGWEYW
jgi:hypothetical protein